jgi:hypothetical protein
MTTGRTPGRADPVPPAMWASSWRCSAGQATRRSSVPYRPHGRPWCPRSTRWRAHGSSAPPSTTYSAPRDDRSTPRCAATWRPASGPTSAVSASTPVLPPTVRRRRSEPGPTPRARHALQRRPTGLSTPASEAGHDPVGTTPDPLVVQRKVGFEFETPWRAKRISTGEPLAKRELIGTRFDGFKVEADADPEGGHSEIEFIVDPPVEEGAAGERRLTTVMRGVTRLGDQMERASVTTDAKPVDGEESARPTPEVRLPFLRLYKATGRLVDDDFAIIPRGSLRGCGAGHERVQARCDPAAG